MLESTRRTTWSSGIYLGVGSVAMVAAILLTASTTTPGAVGRLLAMALAAGIAAAMVPDWRCAAGVALIGHLLYIGFLINGYGELTWDGRQSLWRLAVFTLAFWIGRGQRWMREGGRSASTRPASHHRQGRVKKVLDPVAIASGSCQPRPSCVFLDLPVQGGV